MSLKMLLAVILVLLVSFGIASASDPALSEGLIAPSEPAAAVAAPAPSAPVKAGVTGMIKTDAEATEEDVDLASDPYCVGQHAGGMRRSTIKRGPDGGLADAFVQLTGVPDERYETPETPVELDQRGCTYVPHVFGVMKKQEIKIINSDDTLHNIHAVPKDNREFNVGMPNKGMTITKDFKKDEEAIHIKCDVHPWMSAWCFSMAHPYFAVTNANGNFSIDTADLPDGEYGVKVWHESLGEFEGTCTVKDGAATFEHSFGG